MTSRPQMFSVAQNKHSKPKKLVHMVLVTQSRVRIRDAAAPFLNPHPMSKEEVTVALVSQFLLGLLRCQGREAEARLRVASSLQCGRQRPLSVQSPESLSFCVSREQCEES